MLPRTALVAALALAAAGCAIAPEQSAEARPEKIYRTGSNIPVRDPSAPSEVKQVKIDDNPSMHSNLPSPAAFGK